MTLDGDDVTGARPIELAARGVCHVPEGRGVFPSLTVRENLSLAAGPGGKGALDKAIDAFPRLGERLSQTAGTMSGGEQQMLALARAYIADPKVMLLDEVSMGLAPKIVDEIFEFLGRVAQEGRRCCSSSSTSPGRSPWPTTSTSSTGARSPTEASRPSSRTRTSSPATSAPTSEPGTSSLPVHHISHHSTTGDLQNASHPHHRRPGRCRPHLRRHRLVSGRRRRVRADRGLSAGRQLHIVRRPGHRRGFPVQLRGAGVRGRRHVHRRRRSRRARRCSTGSATRSRSRRCRTRRTTPSAARASSPG